jgi:two-component system chemotaxis sensor kinase CheA
MDELLEQFLIEGRELVAQAAADFASLARDPANPAAIDSAFRAMHTLKGSVAVFAMQPAERALHAAEDLLERARKGVTPIDAPALEALIACLDQTDRWIDEMETAGKLSSEAHAIGERVIAAFASRSAAAANDPYIEPSSALAVRPAGWLGDLVAREAAVIAGDDRALIAFRYSPDPQCFFRGEDPLLIVAAVPDLIALQVMPAQVTWPASEELEPFECFVAIEGLSAAPIAAIKSAFRMMPDLVEIAPVERGDSTVAEADTASRAGTSLRVEAARVDALVDDLGALLIEINAIAPLAAEADGVSRALAARIRLLQASLGKATGNLRRTVDAVRSVALEPVLRRLPRMAREIADGLGKKVEFVITGAGTEVDKQVADGLFEPLLHLLRNAIDHGLETPDRRGAAGKQLTGRIDLKIGREGDMIVVEMTDDGTGIDPAAIRAKAVAQGIISPEAADGLSDGASLRLIFKAGFSTAVSVTEISGRGVGMDAVQAAIESLRGVIEVESVVGQSTTFRFRLPTNALTTRLLVVEAGGDRYGVALDQVVETIRVEAAALVPVGGGTACVLRGRTVPVLCLAELLGGPATPAGNAKLLVTRSGGDPVALRVDGFAERLDALVRPTGRLMSAVPGVVGSAVLGDGAVLLVLDLPELAA